MSDFSQAKKNRKYYKITLNSSSFTEIGSDARKFWTTWANPSVDENIALKYQYQDLIQVIQNTYQK